MLIEVVWVRVPDFPMTVTTPVPRDAPLLAVNVRLLAVLVGFDENAAVIPFGRPVADRVTLPVNPPDGATVMVLVAFAPCLTDSVAGEAARVKLGAFTTNVTEALAVV